MVCREGNFSCFARKRGGHFSGLALLAFQKCVVFCGTFGCTGKGHIERETSLAALEREGGTFQGLLCLPLKSVGFLWHFSVHW